MVTQLSQLGLNSKPVNLPHLFLSLFFFFSFWHKTFVILILKPGLKFLKRLLYCFFRLLLYNVLRFDAVSSYHFTSSLFHIKVSFIYPNFCMQTPLSFGRFRYLSRFSLSFLPFLCHDDHNCTFYSRYRYTLVCTRAG